MIKDKITTIHEKNRVTENIINAMVTRKSFLICGHRNPDEDCLSSMIAFAILLEKFDKNPQIYIDGYVPETMNYLLNICKYNSINLINKNDRIRKNIDTIVICDTPKFSALDINKKIQNLFNNDNIIKIEIDHHIGCDSEYIGDKDYLLVTEASSSSELIGFLTLKLNNKKEILKKFMITDPFSRNLVLAIITGIVGDTNMGQFLKSRREKKYYNIFANTYNDILMKTTVKETNFGRIEEISNELHRLSVQEDECYNYIITKHQFSNSIGYIILKSENIEYLYNKFDNEIIASVSKHIANELAEESGKLSMVVYYDNPKKSNLIQFKMRRCHSYKDFDLKQVLKFFSIADGGGHEGAIGFRFPKEQIENLEKFITKIITRIEEEIGS